MLRVTFPLGFVLTFRHKAYPEYKAQREETPEGIKFAVPYFDVADPRFLDLTVPGTVLYWL